MADNHHLSHDGLLTVGALASTQVTFSAASKPTRVQLQGYAGSDLNHTVTPVSVCHHDGLSETESTGAAAVRAAAVAEPRLRA